MNDKILFIRIPSVRWERVNYKEYKVVTDIWIAVKKICAIYPCVHLYNGAETQYVSLVLLGIDRNIDVDMSMEEFTDLLNDVAEDGIIL